MRGLVVCCVLLAGCEFDISGQPGEFPGDGNPVSVDASAIDASATTPDAQPSADGPGCTPGAACDDLDSCTEYDSCVGGECRGVNTQCQGSCSNTCSTCVPGGCCNQLCPNGNCPSCPLGCSCDLSCGNMRPCNLTCETGSHCALDSTGTPDGDFDITCEAGSSCTILCVGDEGNCTVNCQSGAVCQMTCSYADGNCSLNCASGATSCGGGVQVCDQPCPG